MFPSFTGSARRPRQVNLSGRNTSNPFAAHGAALANAQQDRVSRQQERERLQAAKTIQKVWRGHSARRRLRAEHRRQWDLAEANGRTEPTTRQFETSQSYTDDEEALRRFSTLLTFLDLSDESDLARLRGWGEKWPGRLSAVELDSEPLSDAWHNQYARLELLCIRTLRQERSAASIVTLLPTLRSVAARIPDETASNSQSFYVTIQDALRLGYADADEQLIATPLRATTPKVFYAYENFALHILTLPLPQLLGEARLRSLAALLNHNTLGRALAEVIREDSNKIVHDFSALSRDARVWLLSHFIYVYGAAYNFGNPARYCSGEDFILVAGTLLASLADEIEIEPSQGTFDDLDETVENTTSRVVPAFARKQIASLVNQEGIGGLLAHLAPKPEQADSRREATHSRVLAGYILALLRLFPRRGDEIRMWLYLGLRPGKTSEARLPVVRYFWTAVKSSEVFQSIEQDSRAATRLLKSTAQTSRNIPDMELRDEWRVVLIFLELYIFVLKVMDDQEFFDNGKKGSLKTLSLLEIQAFTTFLKNLGFTMYYNAAEILGNNQHVTEAEDIGQLFRMDEESASSASIKKTEASNIAGLPGVGLDYVKGLVTGILRQIYARDSRRPFLPAEHWLMTSRFDMVNFIDAVVVEEEKRHRVQEDQEEDDLDELEDHASTHSPRLVGTMNTTRTIRTHQSQRQRLKATRQRYLQAVAPRLEILQNMPFLIPFMTRVQIFRRFVYLDKVKRRGGFVDGEQWRLSQMADPLRGDALTRHQAQIRREHEFEDAFERYFNLGAGLKEPIQITFVDKFGSVEAGIDGGGVTKEFLTSVTTQAFRYPDGVKLFVENAQHLLYPNPSALDEQREHLMRDFQISETDPAFRDGMKTLLRKFEFLGRVIGKCLYEGILVDIGFAGFFLLKWALTGGTNSAPRESGYRASINDLRDFDESLYQGLLTLKNYTGDVEKDFSLDFTVSDTVSLPDGGEMTITRDLKSNGSQIPVTNANRLVYIADISRHRLLTQPYHQTNAFLKGLSSIIEPSWLSMFNQVELQTLVGGAASAISISDLRRNTVYGGVYTIGDDGREHPSVGIFWAVMEALSEEERRKVLKFVTSTPRAPLLGFASLHPRFSIRDAGGDESRLPSTSTCVNLLKLPRYSSVAVCRAKLLQAVNSGAGFDLS